VKKTWRYTIVQTSITFHTITAITLRILLNFGREDSSLSVLSDDVFGLIALVNSGREAKRSMPT
jgi:hypothetical protein